MPKVANALAIPTLVGMLGIGGCPVGAAYGPSSDDRLDEATENLGTVQAAGSLEDAVHAIEGTDCKRFGAALVELEKENDEESQLAGLTEVLGRLQAAIKEISEVTADRPGSAYFAGKTSDGMQHDLPDYIQSCESSLIDSQRLLDQRIRDVLIAPVVQDLVRGRRKPVNKARVDFDLLINAISVLAPPDQDALISQVDDAKTRLSKPRKKKHRRGR